MKKIQLKTKRVLDIFSNVEEYKENYFLNHYCEGFGEFKKGEMSFRLRKALEYLNLKKGESLLDVGCGRGEIILNASKKGVKAIGIDSSKSAVRITKKLLRKSKNAKVILADATKIPFDDNSFDKVLMEDVIEHLTEKEAILALKEISRVLKPNGVVVIHTAPNTYFIRYVYPFAKLFIKLFGKNKVIENFDTSRYIARKVHKNELNPITFYKLARKSGLRINLIIERDILRSGKYLLTRDLIKIPVFRILAKILSYKPFVFFTSNDMFVVGTKKY